ncbi:hypothetical protein [Synechococcus sp. BMK-MC-1]|uniref:hypothetical protein n=1 Tax=Synechococcus sp. BMK-MC-1 TaxID=1442551 RepID=UPI001CA42BFE|nr:hypothetical protein [Synechococcus sp. BMK-MC-1]
MIIATLPGFITQVKVKHGIKACQISLNIVSRALKVSLHIFSIGNTLGTSNALPPGLTENERGAMQAKVIESLAKQSLVQLQHFNLPAWSPLWVPAIIKKACIGVNVNIVKLSQQLFAILRPKATVTSKRFSRKIIRQRNFAELSEQINVLNHIGNR